MVQWLKRLQRGVPQETRNLGEQYFKSGVVTIQDGTGGRAVAVLQVRNKRLAVDIELEDDDVVAICSCRDSHICQHVWATLIAAEEAGHLQRIASVDNPRLITEEELLDFVDDLPEAPRMPKPLSTPLPKPAPPPPWKGHLAALRRISEPPPPPPWKQRRIVYIVDVDDCISSNGLIVKIAESNLKKNGEWGKPAFHHGSVSDSHSLDASDRRMLGLLSGSATSHYSYSHAIESFNTRHRVPLSTFDVIVPMLCATERFYLGSIRKTDELQLLHWDGGAPWEVRLTVPQDESSGDYTIK